MELAQAMFILNPGTVVPVTVDLFRPEKAGMAKFVGGGVAGAATGVGKAGLSGLVLLNAHVMAAYKFSNGRQLRFHKTQIVRVP